MAIRRLIRHGKGWTQVGKTKDIRGAVEAELTFDPLVDAANITVTGQTVHSVLKDAA
jgi:hypothetical protein